MPYANPIDAKMNDKRRYRENPARKEGAIAHSRKPETKRLRRFRELLKKYGLTEEQYLELLISQNYCCAICKDSSPGRNRDWMVDHCHDTGKVRGLLCIRCNFAVGHLRNNAALCKATAAYLLK